MQRAAEGGAISFSALEENNEGEGGNINSRVVSLSFLFNNFI